MPQPDWQQPPPYDAPPGPVAPPPGPQDDGWAQWLRDVAKDAKNEASGTGQLGAYDVKIRVTVGTSTIRFISDGDNPGDWEREPVTAKTMPPKEYKDFTRFKRKYTNITVREYTEVKVTVTITFPDGKSWENTFTFWKPGAVYKNAVWYVYRWMQTSGIREATGLEWYNGYGPSNDLKKFDRQEDDMFEERDPPAKLLSMALPLGPREGGELAAVLPGASGWRPASQETLLAFGALGSVKVAALESPKKGGKPVG